jgi:tripartite-type tricarboxylate transporter receptor subunit TctC
LDREQVCFLASLSENKAPPPYDKLPTVKELGYPVSWELTNIVIGPPNLPKEIVSKIASAIEQAAKDPDCMTFAQERDTRLDHIAPEKIILMMDQRCEVVKEIMAKVELLKKVNLSNEFRYLLPKRFE